MAAHCSKRRAGASARYDAASWASSAEIGAIGVAIPTGTIGVDLAVTATPDGTQNTSADSGDQADDGADAPGEGGCAAGGGAGWLALAPGLLVLRRRRR